MNPQRKLIVTCVLAVAAVGLLIWVMRPKHSPLGQRAGATLCVCAACGHESTQTLKSVPDKCPSCHKPQLYPAVKCPQCGTANALVGATGPQQRTPFITCRRCGKQFAPTRK
jgi:DNA-directed RNA polymerase subunit RPC12/RpoP